MASTTTNSPTTTINQPPAPTDAGSNTAASKNWRGIARKHAINTKSFAAWLDRITTAAASRAKKSSWLKLCSLILTLATFVATVFTLVYYNYRTDKIARWTAAKDFYQQCRDLSSTNQSDPNCDSVAGKRLSPPPYASEDFYTSAVKRGLSIARSSPTIVDDREMSLPAAAEISFFTWDIVTWVSIACFGMLAICGCSFVRKSSFRRWVILISSAGSWSLRENSAQEGQQAGSRAIDRALKLEERKLQSDSEMGYIDTTSESDSYASTTAVDSVSPSTLQSRRTKTGQSESLRHMQKRIAFYNRKKQFDKATTAQENLVGEMKRVRGLQHEETLEHMTRLTYLYRHQSRFPAARRTQEEILRILKKLRGDKHPSVLDQLILLSDTCKQILSQQDAVTRSVPSLLGSSITFNDMKSFAESFIAHGEHDLASEWLNNHFHNWGRKHQFLDQGTIHSMGDLCSFLREFCGAHGERMIEATLRHYIMNVVGQFPQPPEFDHGLAYRRQEIFYDVVVPEIEKTFGPRYEFGQNNELELWGILFLFLDKYRHGKQPRKADKALWDRVVGLFDRNRGADYFEDLQLSLPNPLSVVLRRNLYHGRSKPYQGPVELYYEESFKKFIRVGSRSEEQMLERKTTREESRPLKARIHEEWERCCMVRIPYDGTLE